MLACPGRLPLTGKDSSALMESRTRSGRANVDQVLDAQIGVEPVDRLHLAAAADAEQQLIGHVRFRQPDGLGFGAVHIEDSLGRSAGCCTRTSTAPGMWRICSTNRGGYVAVGCLIVAR